MELVLAGWLFGVVANSALSTILKAIKPRDFEQKLEEGLTRWNENLPTELKLPEPGALFQQGAGPSVTPEDVAIIELRRFLNNEEVPSKELFCSALLEQWRRTRTLGIDGLVPFFQIEENDALPHLRDLSEVLRKKVLQLGAFSLPLISEGVEALSTPAPVHLIDGEIERQLIEFQRYRLAAEFDGAKKAEEFSSMLMRGGNLSQGSAMLRSVALGWCARLLIGPKGKSSHCEEILQYAAQLPNSPEIDAARALFESNEDPVASLMKLNTRQSIAIAFNNRVITTSASRALDWLNDVGEGFSDLPHDSQSCCLINLQKNGDWDKARDLIEMLEPENLRNWPILGLSAAISMVGVHVPIDLRENLRLPAIVNPASFPLAHGEDAESDYQTARSILAPAYQLAEEDGYKDTSDSIAKFSIWLGLRTDAENQPFWLNQLKSKLSEGPSAFKFVDLGLIFGSDLSVEKAETALRRHLATTTEITVDAALAFLAIVAVERDPARRADRFLEYKSQLAQVFGESTLASIEVETLVNASRLNEANNVVQNIAERFPEVAVRLRRLVDEAGGIDTTDELITNFNDDPSFQNLHELVATLEAKKDTHRLAPYAKKLFESTRSADDAKRYIYVLDQLDRVSELGEFLRENDFFSGLKDPSLDALVARHHFDLGRFQDAISIALKSRDELDADHVRAIWINAMLFSGDWEGLEDTARWFEKNSGLLGAQELLQVAKIIGGRNPELSFELVSMAMQKEELGANEYLAAYEAGIRSNNENKEEIFEWFRQAQVLSGESGPITSHDISEVYTLQESWQERSQSISQMVFDAHLPIPMAANELNRTSMEMTWLTAEQNRKQTDARTRQPISSRFGRKICAHTEERKSACLSIESLWLQIDCGLLPYTFALYDKVYVPHNCFVEFLRCSEKLRFHQPSRVENAKRVRSALGKGVLRRDESIPTLQVDLLNEVGMRTAKSLSIVRQKCEDGVPTLYIHPGEITRITTLGAQLANIGEDANLVAGCRPIVEYLFEHGLISEQRCRDAISFLDSQGDVEKGVKLDVPCTLILDSLSCDYLVRFDLLELIKHAGFQLHLIPEDISDYDALIEYDELSDQLLAKLDSARRQLREQISKGKLEFLPLGDGIRSVPDRDPLLQSIDACSKYDEFISDDRAINRKLEVSDSRGNSAAIISSVELVESFRSSGAMSEAEALRTYQLLRSGLYCFVPLSVGELKTHLSAARVVEGLVRETPALRTIREYMLKSSIAGWLILPEEREVLELSRKAIDEAIQEMWISDIPSANVRAYSNWLVELSDIRDLVKLQDTDANSVIQLRAMDLWRKTQRPVGLSPERKKEFESWVEDEVLAPLDHAEPNAMKSMVEFAKRVLTDDY